MNEEATEREAITRIERALDEAYSRYAGSDEPARVEGLVEALAQALAAEPANVRGALLDHLEQRHAIDAPSAMLVASPPPAANTAEVEELQREIERLRQAQAAAPAVPAGDRAILQALLSGEAERLGSNVDGTRTAGVVQALAAFALDMVKGFLSTPGKQGDSIVQFDRFRTTLRGELTGTLAAGSTHALLNTTRRSVGVQIEAFSVACTRGAKSLLDELGPELLEDQCSEGGFGPFKYKGMWETFVRRYRELADAEGLFETYFDPALRNAIYQLGEKK